MIKVIFTEQSVRRIEVEVPEEMFPEEFDAVTEDPPHAVRELIYTKVDANGFDDIDIKDSRWEIEEPEVEFMEEEDEN
jgi:hypothetical protein